MKKFFALLLTAVLAFGMFGCGGSEEPEDSAMLTEEGAEEEDPEAGFIIWEGDVPLAGEPGSEGIHDYVFEVVELVNEERAAANIAPVSLNTDVCVPAQLRAEESVKSFSHTRPNGSTCFTALKEADIAYAYAGENLAGRIKTPEKVVDAWMNSPGHKKNIMNPNYSQIGIGYVPGSNYWCQFFVG